MSTHPFRSAVEAGDIEAALGCLADDIVFDSPVAFRPFTGVAAVGGVLRVVFETFEDFRYEDEIATGPATALIFRCRIGEREIHGLDLIHDDTAGRIDQFTVMVRPLSAAIALAEAVGPKIVAAGLK
jgi:hypothetical protein